MTRPAFSDYAHTNPRQRKLTREQVQEAMRRYNAGEPVGDIAAHFGVTAQAISYHAAKHTVLWRDRPGRRRDARSAT